jgi:hypothetical protein
MVDSRDLKKSDTLEDILRSEHLLVHTAPERYGMYFFHARDTTFLLSKSVTSIEATQINFGRFFSYTKKHHLLAVLSTLRLHKVQAFMNLRHVLEAGAWAAYAIANREFGYFVETGPDGMIDMTQKLTGRRNRWLDTHFPKPSSYIKKQKDSINEAISHAGIVYAEKVFDIDEDTRTLQLPFFDREDIFHVQADLWLIAAVGIQIMDLFCKTKLKFNGMMEFTSNFPERINALHHQHLSLQYEMQHSARHEEIIKREQRFREQVEATKPSDAC